MTINDFNLLEIDLFENGKLVYTGMSEDVPEEYRKKDIRINGIDGKKMITEIILQTEEQDNLEKSE